MAEQTTATQSPADSGEPKPSRRRKTARSSEETPSTGVVSLVAPNGAHVSVVAEKATRLLGTGYKHRK